MIVPQILIVVAVQKYLGLGPWVWWLFGIEVVLSLLSEIAETYGGDRKP